jgi:RNA polymerase sigma-70 factor (ECF subfamily)
MLAKKATTGNPGNSALTESEIDRLAAQAKAGNADAFAELIDFFTPRLLADVRYRGIEDAEDLVQSIWSRVIGRLGLYDETRHFKAWLWTVARHKRIDQLRHLARRPAAEPIGDEIAELPESGVAGLERQEVLTALAECMDLLSPDERHLIWLRYNHSQPWSEIADETGKPAGTLRRQAVEIRGKLEICLRAKGFEGI